MMSLMKAALAAATLAVTISAANAFTPVPIPEATPKLKQTTLVQRQVGVTRGNEELKLQRAPAIARATSGRIRTGR